jgi:hypothetical protein
MKFLPALFCAMSLWAADPAVREVKAVYLLSMTNGLDQYLASQLTKAGVVQVVTDPLKADAVLTDRVGEGFERKLADLYAPKPAPKPEAPPEEDKNKKKKAEAKALSLADAKENESVLAARVGSNSWGRGRGNLFLVQRATGHVIWSTMARPKDTTPQNLAKLAGRIADQLKRDRTEAKP